MGKLGNNHYYCGDCCLELQVHPARGRIEVFDIDEEGNLTAAGIHDVAPWENGSSLEGAPVDRNLPRSVD